MGNIGALLMFRRRVIYNNISLKNFAEKKGFSYNCMSTVANESNNFKDPFNVQLLDDRLHKYLFGDKVYEVTKEKIKIATRLLERHNLGTQRLKPFPPVDQLELPPLDGDVITYLNDVAQKQCEPYKQYSMNLSTLKPSPMPKEWRLSSGWTRYDTISSGAAAKGERVSAPLGNAMVFDVEVNFRESQYPVIAVALCYENVQQDGQDPDSTFVNGVWYSWCSSNLVSLPGSRESIYKRVNELIPLSRRKPHLIVGHNICYDRARLECEYTFEESNNRFLDTMSMHISLNGLTAAQKRLLLKLRKATALGTASEEKLVRIRDMWTKVAALNSLKDVYRLYIKKELDKTARDLFVEGSLEDIKENAQDCFRYCAADVLATLEVL
jgi:DNA polymerase gamma 1